MNPWLHKRIVYPSVLALTGQSGMYRELGRLRTLERDPKALRRVTLGRLARVLDAARRVPFYGTSMDRVGAADRDPLMQLSQFPLLRKADLQSRLEELRVPGASRGTRKTTGGSTGEPVTVVKSHHGVARERAASWLGYGWFGVRIGDRAVRFWGEPRTRGRQVRSFLADVAMNRKRLSAFAFREQDLRQYWETCRRFRPRYLYGYASMLEEFARYVLRENLPGRSLNLKVVIPTAEPLTASRRTVMEEAFGSPVQNEYGCGEVGPIAYECPEGLLHIMSQNVLMEVLDKNAEPVGPGGSGEIVVTDLNNRSTLLLRYVLGDYATVASGCDCGRAFPALSAVWGRAYDFLEDSTGRRYHGEAVMYIFEDLRDRGVEVGRFQVIQGRPGHIRVRVVPPAGGGKPVDTEAIERMCVERLGGMETMIELVDTIPRAASGKIHLIRRLDHVGRAPTGEREGTSDES